MSSTDSAGSARGPSCGLVSSLFPSSCRGRAEAFARRLHRRLTSLGGENERNADADKQPRETSWLHPSSSGNRVSTSNGTTNHVFQRQPRHSPESDLFYELEDGPGSPAEEATTAAELAHLLMNPEILKANHHDACHCSPSGTKTGGLHQDAETVYASPINGTPPDSDSSELFFDPESSDTEKPKSEAYFDPTDSEVTLSNCSVPSKRTNLEDTSESCSREQPCENGGPREDPSSEDSQETTSPSHESLWSTFDDSTVSLQDDGSPPVQIRLPKSHSDSELPTNELDRWREENVVDEVDFAADESKAAEYPLYLKTDDTYSSTINIPITFTLECPAGDRAISKNEVELQIGDDGDDDDGKMRLLLTKLSSAKEEEEEEEESSSLEQSEAVEEEEEEEERPQRIRRCSSLKTGKTPPGTPGRKKIVRFADVLGLDLAAVRTFLDEIPRIPNSAYSDLVFQKDDFFQKDSSPVSNACAAANSWADCYQSERRGSRKIERMLVPLFQQPGGMANFLDLVRERRVCLENVLVQNPVTLAIQGTVRVINLDFHKSVHIRYTLNSWRNFSDLQATYVPNSCDGFSDKFSFVLYCHTLSIGQRLEFAVRFQCKGAQYWDNNGGANYCFQCLPGSSPAGYIPITEGSRHVDWSPMFY
ncbi:PREDICTED: glycogen-binding subunit 76A isoform X3 [Dinoponera quadriceps]|uniref:Glycogen-binding subunit 76A isoform X3 n=1 Tax=Dinoponera quadriceps TaxID=609295 RepID=A0A6P3Y0R2_DINQU|nr:PREDICTED: glycogen-binding subunit 76A isoform X3 [Dinoponera quadriceps]